ncbi:MAG: hypothetical protein GQ574_13915 [Crocinitomix sp.]|nr:hypothetical protein [Crocinitomix sp.]
MLRIFAILFLVSFASITDAQTYQLSGTVVDVDGIPIPDAYYFFSNTPLNKKKTSRDGAYSIRYTVGKNDTLKFKHVGFDPYSLVITERMMRRAKKSGKINLEVVMPNRVTNIITVTSNVPDTLFGTQEYSVSDFEFDKSGQLILLTYEKNLSKGAVLRLLDTNQMVIDAYYVPGDAVELRTDFRKNTHLITEEKVFLVNVVDDRMKVYLEDRDYYFKYIAPLIDTIDQNIYFSNYSEVYPAFDYLEFNRIDSSYTTMKTVEDTLMMELYRSEFKYVDVRTKIWAHDKQLETGIDKEIWVGATVFTNSVYYEPLYAPLFKVGEDSIYVFDHYKNLMFKYTPEQGFVDSVRIDYHRNQRKSGWEQPLIQDRSKRTIYATFERNGYTYLSEIDRNTGIVLKSFRLHFKYVEHIKIIDGYVYYIYRPYESVQKKYIYREKLRSAPKVEDKEE